ncbi:MAG TPA: oligosaccharide flippase family protein [Vicinamibacterales bacterium]|nr:oligosaccharide flippase family protein [Vicinamibacterales bacterium]
MSRLRKSLSANFLGQAYGALMGLAFVPFYVKGIGIEAYGLIGFFMTLQGLLQVLDFGLSPTMNREMARYSVQPERAAEARDFVRSVEVCYWAIGLVIGLVIVCLAPVIAKHWLQANALPVSVVERTIAAIGIVSALQWPLSLYLGGLQGLHRQVELNTVQILASTLKNAGAAAVIYLVSPTITAFFAWQILASIVQTTAIRSLLWRFVPGPREYRPRLRLDLLKDVRRFAVGVGGVAVSSLILTQLDKIILSTLLTLEQFGFYSLAASAGMAVGVVVTPVFSVVFPRLSSLVALGDEAAIAGFYHRGAQVMSVIVLPVAGVLAAFSYQIMWLWTGSAGTAALTSPVVTALALGTALNGVMSVPWALQLAYGRTDLALRIHVILLTLIVPNIIILTRWYGPIGAASAWLLLNSVYLAIGPTWMHRTMLRGHGTRWLVQDVGVPALAVGIVVITARQLMPPTLLRWEMLLVLGAVSLVTLATAVFSAPAVRSQAQAFWRTATSRS